MVNYFQLPYYDAYQASVAKVSHRIDTNRMTCVISTVYGTRDTGKYGSKLLMVAKIPSEILCKLGFNMLLQARTYVRSPWSG